MLSAEQRARKSVREKERYARNKAERNAQARAYYAAHKEHLLAHYKKYREENRAQTNAFALAWRQRHPERCAAWTAKRRADTLRRTPPWVDMNEINRLYIEARERGMEVDHIVPLVHDEVSGLHVVANLRVIPETVNRRKSNKLLPELCHAR